MRTVKSWKFLRCLTSTPRCRFRGKSTWPRPGDPASGQTPASPPGPASRRGPGSARPTRRGGRWERSSRPWTSNDFRHTFLVNIGKKNDSILCVQAKHLSDLCGYCEKRAGRPDTGSFRRLGSRLRLLGQARFNIHSGEEGLLIILIYDKLF